MRPFYRILSVAAVLAILAAVLWTAPGLAQLYFQAQGGRLLAEAFRQAGQAEQEVFVCTQPGARDHKARQLASQSIEVLERAHTSQSSLMQGRAYCLLGEAEKAVAAYKAYTDNRPENPLGQLELGFAYELMSNEKLALQAWEKGQVSADHFWAAGQAAYTRGEYEWAIQWLDRAILVDPEWYKPHLSLGLVYIKQGQTEQAIAALQTAAFYEDNPEVQYHLGDLLLRTRQDYSGALEAFQKAAQSGQHTIAAWVEIGRIHEKLGNPNEALAAYQAAIAASERVSNTESNRDWKRTWPYYSLGEYLLRSGDVIAAVDAFQQAIGNDPRKQYTVLSLWGLGRAMARNGQHVQAQEYLFEALELGPPNSYIKSQIYLTLGQNEIAQERIQEGIAYLRTAVDEDPSNQGLHLFLAQTLHQEGYFTEALQEYELYLTQWPTDTSARKAYDELKDVSQSDTP